VFAKMPDHTGAVAKMSTAAQLSVASTSVKLRFAWSGADVRLQTLTAGLRNFWIQKRVDGGAWVTVSKRSTARSWSPTISRGHRVEVRVRARDRKGNLGRWSAPMSANS
jgi:hypothetical protein